MLHHPPMEQAFLTVLLLFSTAWFHVEVQVRALFNSVFNDPFPPPHLLGKDEENASHQHYNTVLLMNRHFVPFCFSYSSTVKQMLVRRSTCSRDYWLVPLCWLIRAFSLPPCYRPVLLSKLQMNSFFTRSSPERIKTNTVFCIKLHSLQSFSVCQDRTDLPPPQNRPHCHFSPPFVSAGFTCKHHWG